MINDASKARFATSLSSEQDVSGALRVKKYKLCAVRVIVARR